MQQVAPSPQISIEQLWDQIKVLNAILQQVTGLLVTSHQGQNWPGVGSVQQASGWDVIPPNLDPLQV